MKEKIIIILVWFLDVLGISIIIPSLPELAHFFQVSEHQISYWVTVYAFASFLATPLLWQLSDIYWRKKILVACIIWTFLSSLTIVFFHSFVFYIFARIISWITWWNMSILQAMINDISKDKKEKMTNMWILWSLFWSAFIIWPLFWGFLLHKSVLTPYIFLAWLSFIEIIVLIFFLKETNKNIEYKKLKYNPFWLIIKYFKKEHLNLYLYSLFFMMLAFSIYQSILSLYLDKEYWIWWTKSWYIFALIWLIMIINQVFLLKQFWLKYFKQKCLLYIINFWTLFIYILLSFITEFYYFIFIFLMITPFQSLMAPVYQTEILENAWKNEKWEISWVAASLQAVAMFIWPLIGWILLKNDLNIFIISWFIVLISIFFVFKIIKKYENI